MEFEIVRIYLLSVCWDPKILLPWQRDVTTYPLYTVCVEKLYKIELRQKIKRFLKIKTRGRLLAPFPNHPLMYSMFGQFEFSVS